MAASDVFQAIADPTRRRILEALLQDERPVSDLAGRFSVTLSAISQHMRVLREAGLVTVRRAGRERLYSLNADPLQSVSDWVGQYGEFWQAHLDALGEHLEHDL